VILWLNPTAGLSGDMLLGALLDLGAPLDAVRAAIASTGVQGWSVEPIRVQRQGIRALHAQVAVTDSASERSAVELIELVSGAQPEPVGAVARAAVLSLAEVEADIHGMSIDEVHLHELGGIDTVVDTVGVAAAAHALGLSSVWSTPLRLGHGQTMSAHGMLPVPAPATLALLAGVPIVGVPGGSETVTPTGAALLAALGCRYGEIPAMTLARTGYGAGTRDTPERPNVLTALLGLPTVTSSGREPLTVLETTVDDVTGEVLGQLIDRLLSAGAVDAWIASVTGKKNRPTQVITALCQPSDDAAVTAVLMAETGTLGVRRIDAQRDVLPRSEGRVIVAGHEARVKVGPHRAKPEYDDLVEIARATGAPVRVIADRAQAAWLAKSSPPAPDIYVDL
jgi:uncharacterized protein (TIGR00299 family) protein